MLQAAVSILFLAAPARAQQSSLAGPALFTPPDTKIALSVHAVGAQIYQCRSGANGAKAWKFREPVAALFKDGETVGRHFVGPTWAFTDGVVVKAKLIASQPGALPGDVPLLRLKVSERQGEGTAADANWVLRLNTQGGVRSGPCEVLDALVAEPYSADYVFAR